MSHVPSNNDIDRRRFIKLAGGGATALFLLPLLQGCDNHTVVPLGDPETFSFITPNDTFFVQNGGEGAISGWSEPSFANEQAWSLKIRDVSNEVRTFTWNDLMGVAAEPGEEITILKTIECVLQSTVRATLTGFTGNAYWTGVRLTRLLDIAGFDYSEETRYKRIVFTGADGFINNVRPQRLRDTSLLSPLLVYRMNGLPLPPEHGFPVRIIMQEGYGYKNVKWPVDIQGVPADIEFGTYQDQGFVDDGISRVNSRATSIFEDAQISSGPTELIGFSLSGFAPIARVEVSIDDAAPVEAEIVPIAEIIENEGLPGSIRQIAESEPYPYRGVWTPWRLTWEATAGPHTIRIKAVDAAGNEQPPEDESVSDGLTAVTEYHITVG